MIFLFMGGAETGVAVIDAALRVKLGHMVDVLFSEAAAVVDSGNLCRQWGEAEML